MTMSEMCAPMNLSLEVAADPKNSRESHKTLLLASFAIVKVEHGDEMHVSVRGLLVEFCIITCWAAARASSERPTALSESGLGPPCLRNELSSITGPRDTALDEVLRASLALGAKAAGALNAWAVLMSVARRRTERSILRVLLTERRDERDWGQGGEACISNAT